VSGLCYQDCHWAPLDRLAFQPVSPVLIISAGDKLTGKKDSIVGAVTGDKAQEAKGNAKETKGDAQMNLNK